MSAEIRARVDARWAEYGLPAHTVRRIRAECARRTVAARGQVGSALTRGSAERLNPRRGATSERRATDDKRQVPAPSLWPIGFAIGIACVLVGLVVSWWRSSSGGALAVVFGDPLGARRRQRARPSAAPRRRGEPRSGRASTTRPTAARVPRPSRRSASAARSAPLVTLPVARLRRAARVGRERRDASTSTSGRSRTSPRASSWSRPTSRTRTRARCRAGPRSSATTGSREDGQAELHGPLQPLRPPRLPGAAERADRRGGEAARTTASSSVRCSRRASAARATAV